MSGVRAARATASGVPTITVARRARVTAASVTIMETLRNPRVWLMVVIYFCSVFLNVNNIWFPTILKSISERLGALPGDTVVHTGHGDSTTIGDEIVHYEEWVARGH